MVWRCPILSGKLWRDVGIIDDVGISDMQEIPPRLMSMVLHTLEARLWIAAWNECAMPEMLPALVAPDSKPREEQVKYLEDLWHAPIKVESEDGTGFGPQGTGFGPQEVRRQIYWLDWPAVQWAMRFAGVPTLPKTVRAA